MIAKASLRFYILAESSQFILLTAFAHWLIRSRRALGAARTIYGHLYCLFSLCCGVFYSGGRRALLIRHGIGPCHHNHTVLRFSMIRWPPQATRARIYGCWRSNGFTEAARRSRFVFMAVSAGAGGHRQAANRRQDSSFTVQFNTSLWLALILGGDKPAQFYWHIWARISASVPRAEIPSFSTRFVSYRAGH